MDFKIEIYIPPSRSVVYREVISKAKQTGLFNEQTRLITFTSITQVWQFWEIFTFVAFTCVKWVGFYVNTNGQMVLPYSHDYYYNLLNVKHCYYAQTATHRKSEYCTANTFGCRRITSVSRHPGPDTWVYQCWWHYGHWVNSTTWAIDKDAMERVLIEDAQGTFSAFCPVFSRDNVIKAVGELPDHIKMNYYWSVDYRATVGANGPEQIPIGIKYNYNKPPDDLPPPPIPDKPDLNSEDGINRFLDNYNKRKRL